MRPADDTVVSRAEDRLENAVVGGVLVVVGAVAVLLGLLRAVFTLEAGFGIAMLILGAVTFSPERRRS